jgi:hypothetical protein
MLEKLQDAVPNERFASEPPPPTVSDETNVTKRVEP